MKKFTETELEQIFASECPSFRFGEEDKRRVLENPELEKFISDLKARCEEYYVNPTPTLPFSEFKRFQEEGNRSGYEQHYYFRRRKLYFTFYLAWLYGTEKYISDLEDCLWAILDEYTWVIPAHLGTTALDSLQEDGHIIDLFAAETAQALSEIVSCIGDKLHPIIIKRINRLIKQRIFDRLDVDFFWKKATNNWSAVCAGAVGMTAIYTMDDPKELARVTSICFGALEYFLSGFPEDGTCVEGLGYWGYGFGYYLMYGELLYRRTGGRINFFEEEKIHKIASFARKCFFKGGKIVTFADCGGSDSSTFHPAFTCKINDIYPDIEVPEKNLLGLSVPSNMAVGFPSTFRILLWTHSKLDGNKLNPDTFILPDAQWYISSSEGGIGLAAKGGHNDESHNHNDIGNILVYKNGVNLLSDLGGGVYNGTYFDSRYRYDVFCCGSQGHSVPVINGKYQKFGSQYCASDVSITEDCFRANIATAYGIDELSSLIRSVKFDRAAEVITVEDEFRFEKTPEAVTERFISYAQPRIDGNTVVIENKNQTLTISFDGEKLKPVIREYHDVEHKVRHRDGFVCYMTDLEVISPDKTFTVTVKIN